VEKEAPAPKEGWRGGRKKKVMLSGGKRSLNQVFSGGGEGKSREKVLAKDAREKEKRFHLEGEG